MHGSVKLARFLSVHLHVAHMRAADHLCHVILAVACGQKAGDGAPAHGVCGILALHGHKPLVLCAGVPKARAGEVDLDPSGQLSGWHVVQAARSVRELLEGLRGQVQISQDRTGIMLV